MPMKIILVATDSKTKSVVFVSDTMQILSLQETFRLVDSGVLKDAHIVQNRYGNYIRSAPNTATNDNLDTLSVSGIDIISFVNQTKQARSTPPISNYLERYLSSLEDGQPFIVPIGQKKVLVADIKSKFILHISLIITAAKEFAVDRYLLGAILIDEIARLHPFEKIIDLLGLKILGRNVSVGVAQIKLETANGLIKRGLYNPNPDDKELPFSGTLSNKNREHLYQYVIQPKHNIRFAAAFIRSLIEVWATHIDITKRPEIIATLYSIGYGDPKMNPVASKAGTQIIEEFYPLAKKWLTDI